MNKFSTAAVFLCAAFTAAAFGADGDFRHARSDGGLIVQLDDADGDSRHAPSDRELITQLDDARRLQEWPQVDALAKEMTARHPDMWVWPGMAAEAEGRMEKHDESFQSFDVALKAALAAKYPPPDLRDTIGTMYIAQGAIRQQQSRFTEAAALYAKALPYADDQAQLWLDLSSAQYHAHDYDAAVQSADKAIALKPDMADPYYFKGMSLVNRSSPGPDGKHVSPDGREALQTYLKLAPYGDHAPTAAKTLASISGTP